MTCSSLSNFSATTEARKRDPLSKHPERDQGLALLRLRIPEEWSRLVMAMPKSVWPLKRALVAPLHQLFKWKDRGALSKAAVCHTLWSQSKKGSHGALGQY